MVEVNVETHKVGVTSYRRPSLSFQANRPSHSWHTKCSKCDLENPRWRWNDNNVAVPKIWLPQKLAPVLPHLTSFGPCAIPYHDDIIKWKHFPRYWPFVRGIYRSPVNSPHKGQWRGALMLPLICVGINGWINTREAGDLRRYCANYDVSVMCGKWANYYDR